MSRKKQIKIHIYCSLRAHLFLTYQPIKVPCFYLWINFGVEFNLARKVLKWDKTIENTVNRSFNFVLLSSFNSFFLSSLISSSFSSLSSFPFLLISFFPFFLIFFSFPHFLTSVPYLTQVSPNFKSFSF